MNEEKKDVVKECARCHVRRRMFDYQKFCSECFQVIKEQMKTPKAALPNSGVGVALLDETGKRIAPVLAEQALKGDSAVLKRCWEECDYIKDERARQDAATTLFLTAQRRLRDF